VRISVRSSLVRRVLLAAVAIALLTPPAAAGAASDPLAAAVARVTAAQKADNRATADFDAAQTHYFQLQDDQASTQRSIKSLTAQQQQLAKLARLRAVVAYKRGGLLIDDIFGNGSDILDAARRARMLNDVNARGNQTIANLTAVTSELSARQSTLRKQIDQSKSAVATMRAREQETERLLASAGKAESDLRAQLAAQHRQQELASILSAARAKASSGGGATSGGGQAGQIIVSGSWVCPVQGPVSFTDTFGSPRGGGRTHKGNDMFSPGGTPVVAVTAGSVFFQGDPLGGLAAYVSGGGNTYYYAHLSDYVGGGRSVSAGELIGHVGNTGDAAGGPTHLHFEIRPGGPNGLAIDPYPTLAAHCG
jgi:murein DD-endopeptidase MepM/ murein hydrolase activator NlpD